MPVSMPPALAALNRFPALRDTVNPWFVQQTAETLVTLRLAYPRDQLLHAIDATVQQPSRRADRR
ncbi:hypothetical protein HC891_24800 [Candidatus Gracilibacteria bacterium]|nr:hypothetical protein [Candidatus Gracilibacteria bacterium]